MKYFVRAVKYYLSLLILIAVILGILVFIGAAEADIKTMFRNGYDALWQIAILFAVIAAIYPKFGFVEKEAVFPGSWAETRDGIAGYMASRNYVIEKEEEGKISFRHKGILNRISRMYEDRITVSSVFSGVKVEGLRKDVFRIAAGLEYNMNPRE